MSMVFHPADFMWHDLFFAANTGHVGPEFCPVVQRNELAALFSAEHNMKKVLYVRVGHVSRSFFMFESVSRLRRSGILIPLPTALPWANLRARLAALDLSLHVYCLAERSRLRGDIRIHEHRRVFLTLQDVVRLN
jgi:hypothetical protein